MKTNHDAALAEIRAARKSLCDRFGNNPRRLLAGLRDEQKSYRGRVIKGWADIESTVALREMPEKKARRK